MLTAPGSREAPTLEIIVFVVIMLVGMLGYLASPSCFVLAWGFHLLWGFLPRAADPHAAHATMGHLGIAPGASESYDALILAYLVIAVLTGRLARPAPRFVEPVNTGSTAIRSVRT